MSSDTTTLNHTPQTFEEWWQTFEWHSDALFDQPQMEEAFAAGVASQQAEIDRRAEYEDVMNADRNILQAELAEAKAEIERLNRERDSWINQDGIDASRAGLYSRRLARYEAVVEAAREFIKYVDGVNQRPMVEGSMLGAATAQAKLRTALAALEGSPQ